MLARVRDGDREALDRLFAKHGPLLRRIVETRLGPRLRRRAGVSDVVQAAHIDALERIDEYLGGDPIPFRWWLRKLAHDRVWRTWRHHFGAEKRDVRREVALSDGSSVQFLARLTASSSSPSQRAGRRELANRVRQALSQLPPTDREIMLMRAFEQRPYDEIGYVLEVSPATARKRYERAILRLTVILRDSGLSESIV